MRYGFGLSPKIKIIVHTIFCMILLILLPVNLHSQSNEVPLRFGFSAYSFQEVSPSDANAAIQIYANAFKERIEKRLNKPVNFRSTIYSSVKAIIDALSEDQLDCMSISSPEYFEIKKQKNIYPALAVTPTNDPYEKLLLVCKNQQNYSDISKLRGKILALPDPPYHPMSDEWLFNYLMKNNLPPIEKMFSQVKMFDKETNAVYDVFFGKSDCAIIRERVFQTLCELNPQMKKKVTVLSESPQMILAFMAVNYDSNRDLINLIMEEIRDFHLTPGGKNILNIYKAKRYLKINEKELDSVKEILTENDNYRKNLKLGAGK